jgi:(1->4)-alpha-D-glucan 1-alpha-D-glucosylmutase
VIARLLALRARQPGLFARGRYAALPVEGRAAAHVIAFARVHRGTTVVVLVPRLPGALYGVSRPFAGPAPWHDTAVRTGAIARARRWQHVLTGATVSTRRHGRIRLAEALHHVPVAVLVPAGRP